MYKPLAIAALLSVTEMLFHDGYDILDGVAVASRGAVKSVFLAHRQPLAEIETIHCDTASLTSVNMINVNPIGDWKIIFGCQIPIFNPIINGRAMRKSVNKRAVYGINTNCAVLW